MKRTALGLFLPAVLIAAFPLASQAQESDFCIGEHASQCPANARHFSCGNTVQEVARSLCAAGQEPQWTLLEQRSGNQCGYNIVRSSCVNASAPAPGTLAEYAVASALIDQTMQPKPALEHVTDCASNDICMGVASAIAQVIQIPVDKAIAAVATVSKSQEPGSETANFSIALPPGYQYCRSSMQLTSIVPYDGPRGSLFSSRALPNGVSAQTWTPRQSDGARSWVEASVHVVGVRNDLAAAAYTSGQCLQPGDGEGRLLYYCRGGGCTSVEDAGQNVATHAPAANSANY